MTATTAPRPHALSVFRTGYGYRGECSCGCYGVRNTKADIQDWWAGHIKLKREGAK